MSTSRKKKKLDSWLILGMITNALIFLFGFFVLVGILSADELVVRVMAASALCLVSMNNFFDIKERCAK